MPIHRSHAFLPAILLGAAALCTVVASRAAPVDGRQPIKLTYLGNAGWQIEDGKTVILVDPNVSQFHAQGTDNPQISADDPIAAPDTVQIDAHIRKADYILITHGHEDHMLDAPYISKKTGAVIICSESAANIARAYGVGEVSTPVHTDLAKIKSQKLIVVRGGEDFQFDGFSVEVIPNLHTPLFDKRYNDGYWADATPAGLKAPLHESDYAEGGTFNYLLRIAGHQVFIMGSMNYIERQVAGLRPDIAIIGAGSDRKQVYQYTARLMQDLGYPPVVFPTHWDDYGIKPRAEALKQLAMFTDEVHAASPQTRVIVPDYFTAIELK